MLIVMKILINPNNKTLGLSEEDRSDPVEWWSELNIMNMGIFEFFQDLWFQVDYAVAVLC